MLKIISSGVKNYTLEIKRGSTTIGTETINSTSTTATYAFNPINYVSYDSSFTITTSCNSGADTPSDDNVQTIYYAWDKDELMMIPNATSYTLTMPSSFAVGTDHYLYVKTKTVDGTLASSFQAYKFKVSNKNEKYKRNAEQQSAKHKTNG